MSTTPLTWTAQWIWTEDAPGMPAGWAYFRRTFRLSGAVAARVMCVADSRYTLWLDGERLGSGPARGVAAHPYYDSYDIMLSPGEHTLALLGQYYGEGSAIFDPVHGGVLCQVMADDAVLVGTDDSWRACPASAYTTLEGVLNAECCDARLEPAGWMLPGFDDAVWGQAALLTDTRLAPPDACLPRPIPPLTDTVLAPHWLVDAGGCRDAEVSDLSAPHDIAASLWRMELLPARAGLFTPDVTPARRWEDAPVQVRLAPGDAAYLALDVGRETLGSLSLRAHGPAGTLVDLGYGELLVDGRVATKWQGMSTADRLILRDGETAHRFHRPRGFRYLLCRIANPNAAAVTVTLDALQVHETVYPTEARGTFDSSDPLLNAIYRLSANTVRLCMMDAFMDCPWREQAQWLGDLHIEALVAYYCFGDYALARKAVQEFMASAVPEGWIPGVAPASGAQLLPTWSARFPVIAWDYYLHTGDGALLPALYQASRRVLDWFATFETADGLLGELPGWSFVDWTSLDSHHNEGVIQGWYLEAITACAELATAAGDAAQEAVLRASADRLREAIARAYWLPARQAFRKYRAKSPVRPRTAPEELIGQHENFLFAQLGVGTPEQRASALQAVQGPTGRYLPHLGDYHAFTGSGQGAATPDSAVQLIGSPYWSFYALTALLQAGMTEEALESMRLSWGTMLEHEDTTCWEGWDRHASLCHGWSGGPAYLLPAYVLGVQPTAPGFTQVLVRPHPGDLQRANGTVPTPQGNLAVSWERTRDSFTLDITIPPNTTARVSLPTAHAEAVREGDTTAAGAPGVRYLGVEEHRALFTVASGSYRFVAELAG